MRLPVRRDDAPAREDGFTLVEMVVSVAVIGVLFLAVSVMLDSGLRALGAAKARARGNDIATAGIEDLQRYGFNSLGLCSPPTGTPPAGLSEWVQLTTCGSANFEEPCNDPVGGVPLAEYTCRRNNIDYTVKRHVAWVDALRTTKRLAVFVEWDDAVGRHQVSQQSSLRAPDQAAITGLAPPRFSSAPTAVPSATPLLLTDARRLATGYSMTLTANTQNLNTSATTMLTSAVPTHQPNQIIDITVANGGSPFPTYNGFPVTIAGESFTVLAGANTNNWRVLASGTSSIPSNTPVTFAGDRVYATVQTIGSNNSPEAHTVFLSSANGTSWARTLDHTSTLQFGAGRQYVSFGILRASDGKTTSAFASTTLRFCPSTDAACTDVTEPSVAETSVPGTVTLGSSGELLSDVVVRARTVNVTNVDTVTVSFLTQAGSLTVVLTQDPAFGPCPGPDTATAGVECRWIGTISMASGYRFSTGSQPFYFGAQQVLDTATPGSIDQGSTGAAVSTDVVFQ